MATKEKTKTIQDVLDSSGEQRDIIDIVVGAAVDNVDLSDNPEIISQYDALSIEQKEIINFVVGIEISDLPGLKHKMDVEEFLSHFGTKGMKWGVTNTDRGAARSKVKAGTADLGEAHIAALKSTGHRVTNAVLGDKTYWKNMAVIAGVTGLGVAASATVLPAVLPASLVVSAGEFGASALGLSYTAIGGVMANPFTTGTLATAFTTTSAFGAQVVTAFGVAGSALAGTTAAWASYASNVKRAATGNAQIMKSYSKLGGQMLEHQTSGTQRVNTILNKAGSISKKDLSRNAYARHSVTMAEAEEYISHFGIKGQRWGVRRSDAQLSSNSADATRAAATQKAIKKGGVSSVSDADLNHLVNRINLQKRYSDISSGQPKTSLAKTTGKGVKTALAVGQTMNKAFEFANSPTGRILAAKVGLYKVGPGKHAGLPKNVIDFPGATKTLGKHRA